MRFLTRLQEWVREHKLAFVGIMVALGFVAAMLSVAFHILPTYDERQASKCSPMDYLSINGKTYCYTLAPDGSIEKVFPR